MDVSSETSQPLTLGDMLARQGQLSPPLALDVVLKLARQLADRHAAGRVHLAVSLAAVEFDSEGRPHLTAADEPVQLAGSDGPDICPPELQDASPLTVPQDVQAACALLKGHDVDVDPRQLDVYQLGTLLCQLLTGQSISYYLCSPSAKAKVPAPLRPLIERAVGCDGERRFADAREFADTAEPLLASLQGEPERQQANAGPRQPPDPPGQEDTSPSIASPVSQSDTSVAGPASRAESSAAADAQLPFQQLGHYEILGRIGHGGMGDVYQGYERTLKRTVAIKVLPDELARQQDFVRRFHDEASAAAQLTHPNIIQIHFIGEDAGHHFFAMQYVDGDVLSAVLAARGRLTVEETLAITEQALSGLAAAHKQGMVHRDIKPSNILIDRENGRVVVADFGLVKSLQDTGLGTATGVIMGTVDYISPEQARGRPVDGRSDLYSVGVLMYQMLSGRLPFQAEGPSAMIFQHVYEPPPPLAEAAPDVPPELVQVVSRLMAKSPEDRHPSADDLLAELRRLRHREPAAAEPSPTAVIQAPSFDEAPSLPSELLQDALPNWWRRTKDRLFGWLLARSPQLAEQLLNTQQQVDGAVAEYERRRIQLAGLVTEADEVLQELRVQAEAQRSAVEEAERRIDSASSDETVQIAAGQQAEATELAAELEQRSREQEDQLEQMRLKLAHVDATLNKLRGQRDALNARLKVAQARLVLTGGRAAARPWTTWAAAAAGVVLLAVLAVVAVRQLWTGSPVVENDPSAAPQPGVPQDPGARVSDDVERAFPVRQFVGHQKQVAAVAFHPDQSMVASGSVNGSLRIWDAKTGGELKVVKAHGRELAAVAFSPDGRILATAGKELSSGAVRLWDPASGVELVKLEGKIENALDVAFDPSGRILTVVDADATALRQWDVQTGRELDPLDVGVPPWRIAYASAGSVLAILGKDSSVRLWDTVKGEVTFTWHEDTSAATCLAISPDGTALARGDATGHVRWHGPASQTRRLERSISAAGPIAALAFSPTGKRLAVASQDSVHLWDLEVGAVRKVLPGHEAKSIAFNTDGSLLISGGYRPFLLLWDAKLPPLTVHTPTAEIETGSVLSIALSTSGEEVLVGGREVLGMWNFVEDGEFRPFHGHSQYNFSVALSANGTYAASGGADGMLRRWQAETGQLLEVIDVSEGLPPAPKEKRRIQAVSFLPDGRTVLAITVQATVLWDSWTKVKSYPFGVVPGIVYSGAVSRDGRYVATGGWDNSEKVGDLRIWDLRSGQHVDRILGHAHSVKDLMFSSDGRLLLAGGSELVHVWEVASQSEISRFKLPIDTQSKNTVSPVADTMAFSPDGRRAVTGGRRFLSLWDVASGEELLRFVPQSKRAQQVRGVEFTKDGRFVVAGGGDGFVRVWDTRPPSVAQRSLE